MSRMLKHHIHPGFFLLFMWLCHLMEHQKVQGKPCSSVFSYSLRFPTTSTAVSLGWGEKERPGVSGTLFAATEKLFKVSFLFFFFASVPPDKTLCIRQCVRKASIKQVPYGTLQSETIWQVLQPSPGAYAEAATLCWWQPQLSRIPEHYSVSLGHRSASGDVAFNGD